MKLGFKTNKAIGFYCAECEKYTKIPNIPQMLNNVRFVLFYIASSFKLTIILSIIIILLFLDMI